MLFFISPVLAMETSLSNEFLQAAQVSDTPRMRNLTSNGVSSHDLESALVAALKAFNVTTCRFIINETNVNCNAIVNEYSLIWHAIFFKNWMALGLLLDRSDINVKCIDKDGLTPLEVFARDGFVAGISKIHVKKVYTPEECKNALLIAIYNKQNDAAFELLKYGIDLNTGYLHNKTPLHRAAEQNNFRMVAALLDAGALINLEDNNGYTPLYIATCGTGDTKSVAQILVARGASVEKTCNFARSNHDSDCEWNIKHWFPRHYYNLLQQAKPNVLVVTLI